MNAPAIRLAQDRHRLLVRKTRLSRCSLLPREPPLTIRLVRNDGEVTLNAPRLPRISAVARFDAHHLHRTLDLSSSTPVSKDRLEGMPGNASADARVRAVAQAT